jgi:hypothetical protein
VATQPEKPRRVSVWARYEEELAPIASRLPSGARKYALAEWHCDPTDKRCIHDSWIEAVSVVEAGSGARKEKRAMGIVIRLLGAYQDRHMLLKFLKVRRYQAEYSAADAKRPDIGHGDVFDDSIRLTPDGYVLYSMNMEFGRIEIEAKDLEFSQQPI